ncbi:hypothetical protein AC578_3876 [Pseudocercospora eumusae]|uniref:Uncharacterized protein n=1 Tax=Pseudocercospora eumusae TaxID=321146 RepID=A0A139H1K8_9PEZI|nr:hypothetical protein AC578_3876 [Pseudocercospora eumusae]
MKMQQHARYSVGVTFGASQGLRHGFQATSSVVPCLHEFSQAGQSHPDSFFRPNRSTSLSRNQINPAIKQVCSFRNTSSLQLFVRFQCSFQPGDTSKHDQQMIPGRLHVVRAVVLGDSTKRFTTLAGTDADIVTSIKGAFVDQSAFTSRWVDRHTLAEVAPLITAEMMGHVQAWKSASSSQVRMHREQGLSQIRWSLQEEIGIRESCVAITLRRSSFGLSIIEDHYLVYAKDCASACDLASETCLLIRSYSAVCETRLALDFDLLGARSSRCRSILGYYASGKCNAQGVTSSSFRSEYRRWLRSIWVDVGGVKISSMPITTANIF